MYRIQGPFGEAPQAVQQDLVECKNLNSGECFMVCAEGGSQCWVWHGSGASDSEKNYANKLPAALLPGVDAITFEEGSESEDFWAALGGKGEYLNFKELGINLDFQARLFEVVKKSVGGTFYLQEIDSFNQSDLNNDAVHVLDAFKTIYVWTGRNADKFEKKNGDKRVDEYINALKDGRKATEISVKHVSPCEEPMYFKSFFPEWEKEVSEQWLLPDAYGA